jgi:microcystin degradation protein MlrC
MRGFVNKMKDLEASGTALSVSAIHGFMAGDSPDLGAKLIVTTDDAKPAGDQLAKTLGLELFSFRGTTRPDFLTPGAALAKAVSHPGGPVVIADVWDNPGGGVAGDSTILLRRALSLGLSDVAFGTIWDPMAVRLCHAAGEGAHLKLRFGGKTSAVAGDPVDGDVLVLKTQKNATQSFGTSIVPLGDCAVIRIDDIDVVLNSNRAQTFSPDLFTKLDIDIARKKILVVKSTNHFHDAFEPVAAEILYCAVEGPYPNDPRRNAYTRLERPIWPIVDHPHGSEAA